MERIVVEMIGEIEEDISNELIKQAASEMISSKVCPLCTCTVMITVTLNWQ